MFWFILGVGLLGIPSGFLVGASHTPVVGAALPLVMGAIPIVLEYMKSKDSNPKRLSALGKALSLFSVIYVGSLVAGIKERETAWLSGVSSTGTTPKCSYLKVDALPWEGVSVSYQDNITRLEAACKLEFAGLSAARIEKIMSNPSATTTESEIKSDTEGGDSSGMSRQMSDEDGSAFNDKILEDWKKGLEGVVLNGELSSSIGGLNPAPTVINDDPCKGGLMDCPPGGILDDNLLDIGDVTRFTDQFIESKLTPVDK